MPPTMVVQAEAYSLGGPDFATPAIAVTWVEENVPELVRIQLQALHHFKIDAKTKVFPKKKELEEYFKTRRLSDGTRISPRIAEFLATCIRPIEAMRGKKPQRVKP